MDDERILVDKCCTGEQRAWHEFVNRYLPVIGKAVTYTLGSYHKDLNQQEIDDICQEVFLKLLKDNARALRKFMWRSSLKSWLSVVASRFAAYHLRKSRRREARLENPENLQAAVQTEATDTLNVTALKEAIAVLMPRDRLLINLSYEENWSYKQIGKLVGISENAVGPAISRAVKRLKEAILKKEGVHGNE